MEGPKLDSRCQMRTGKVCSAPDAEERRYPEVSQGGDEGEREGAKS